LYYDIALNASDEKRTRLNFIYDDIFLMGLCLYQHSYCSVLYVSCFFLILIFISGHLNPHKHSISKPSVHLFTFLRNVSYGVQMLCLREFVSLLIDQQNGKTLSKLRSMQINKITCIHSLAVSQIFDYDRVSLDTLLTTHAIYTYLWHKQHLRISLLAQTLIRSHGRC
jgi:hypothetical protein